MKKRLRKKIERNNYIDYKYCLKKVKCYENEWDYSISYGGNLYYKSKFITSFYEHPYEGGYYQNGIIRNHILYQDFLNRVGKYDKEVFRKNEYSLFSNGISRLMTVYLKNK